MNRLFQFKPNNLFILIRWYSTLFNLLWQIMSNYLFGFVSFRFVVRFKSPLFWFVSIRFRIQTLKIRFGHESNHKKHYSPKLSGAGLRFNFEQSTGYKMKKIILTSNLNFRKTIKFFNSNLLNFYDVAFLVFVEF